MSAAGISRAGIQSEVPVESQGYARASRRRFAITLQHVGPLREPILDLGPPNAFARLLEQRDTVRIVHTGEHDLDREPIAAFQPGPFATITAFEILEHLMNPLFVLDGCRQVLQPEGRLYVTVPQRHPHEWLFGKSPEHFHEFAPDEFRWLLDKADFEIERLALANTSELAVGIRPLLRRLFKNLILVQCRARPAPER